jgi:hypothetical protein
VPASQDQQNRYLLKKRDETTQCYDMLRKSESRPHILQTPDRPFTARLLSTGFWSQATVRICITSNT